ncbi:MAG: hypothetical protein U5J63_10230 [Fodinibius sp.]|nr:hypothetical protein [Fodinibius sp.]
MNEEIIENLNQELDNALDRGRQMVEDEQMAVRLEELKQRAENLVRKHPVKSVAGGLLAGYLLGKILSSDE